jgi:hypothetical protein
MSGAEDPVGTGCAQLRRAGNRTAAQDEGIHGGGQLVGNRTGGADHLLGNLAQAARPLFGNCENGGHVTAPSLRFGGD